MVHDLVASRGLAWRLFLRDTRAQYRQTVFGYAWAFIPPLVASLPFVFLNSQGVVSIKATDIPYAAFAIIGTMIWQVFVDALSSPLKAVTAAKPMLARINFPREAILLSGLGQVLFGFLVRSILLVPVLIWFHITPPTTVLLFPIGIVALILVGFVIGVSLAPLGLLYTDVQQTIPILATFWMFLTPVLYPPATSGIATALNKWNPLSPLVTTTRNWLTTGTSTDLPAFLIVTGATVILFFGAWLLYRLALPHVIARIPN
jgi:lipopolysaccharide transport system permease protein